MAGEGEGSLYVGKELKENKKNVVPSYDYFCFVLPLKTNPHYFHERYV